VDEPSRGELPCPEDKSKDSQTADESQAPTGTSSEETIHSRSLMLSAPDEGLIAKIDVLDLNAGAAVPVDYKRGRVPDVPGGAWEPEQVQVCAQGLILRENGYQCEGGFLYFIESKRRVSIPFSDELVERTRQLARELRAMAARGVLPPPLVDSPKCPRCSLVGICLPDETRLLAADDSQGQRQEVRRLVPARDDAQPLYNALLSFVYAMLVKELTLVLHRTGFDPLLGFYHRPRYGRPSLALDLAEPFRPLIADSTVLTLVNNGEVTPGDFVRRAGGVALTDAGRRAVIAAFERRMDTLVTHPLFGYQVSYRRVLEVQARLLGRAVLGDIAEYPNFCTR
jgi:CRISPR-associated protein Cas4